jgi:hypothetical protein
MKNIGKSATWAVRIAGYSFFLLLGYFGAAAVSDFYLRDKASKFCRSIVEGDGASSLVQAARDAGASLAEPPWRMGTGGADRLVIAFPGLAPFEGYACVLLARNGRVGSREFLELGDLPVIDPAEATVEIAR